MFARQLIDDMRRQLFAPFTCSELHEALSTLARESCLGEDGLILSFFLRY